VHAGLPAGDTEELGLVQAIHRTLDRAMAADDSIILLGEDIGDPSGGGMFKVTAGLSAKYGEAAQAFDAIREQTNDPGVARMALYGLACSRLMTADDPQAYHDALALWNAWVQCANTDDGPYRESPRLLAPVIQDKMLFSHIPLVAADASDGEAGQMVPRWLVVEANRELQKMKQRLTDEQQKSSNREKKIESLEKEIMRLKQQIKAFETIDQKIQKKKNAIPSAD
jgi:hypothetical protein